MPDTNVKPALDRTLVPGPRPAWHPAWRRLLAEPLVHFLALGGLLFALSAALAPGEDRAKVIEVSADVRNEIIDLFQATHRRPPTATELAPLIENWIRTQILYREALALGLDRGDEMIRERITHKMNLLVFSRLQVPAPTEAGLRAWFEANRARYDQPVRYDFFGLALDATEAREGAESIARQLEGEEAEPPAELVARVRVFANRDRGGIAALFGPDFAASLAEMPLDAWRALPTDGAGRTGWFVARVAQIREGRRAEFDEVRPQVEDAWRADTTRSMANEAVSALGRGYVILREPRREPRP